MAEGPVRARPLGELVRLLTRHGDLTWELTKRDLLDRYAGRWSGLFWVAAHPLIVMGVYVFVFAVVFGAKLGGTQDFPRDYTTYILAGLIPWMTFQESMHKSCGAITGQPSFVKQVVFPIAVLPIKGALASFVPQVIALGALVGYVMVRHHGVPWTYSLLPVLLALQVVAMVGVSYILSSVAVYFRDLKDLVQVFGLVGVYVVPVFYLPQWVPPLLQPVLYANPFSYMIWCYQDVLYFGHVVHPWSWLVFGTLSIGVFYVGYGLFRHLKTWFGSAL